MTYDEKLSIIENLCNFYAHGKEIYAIFSKSMEESPKTEIIVSPANLGDTVFIATLAKTYKKVHNVNKLIIVAKERQAQAVEWFEGVDEVLGLTDFDTICLRYYFTISRSFYKNHIRYGHIPCDIEWLTPGTFYHIPPGFSGIPLIDVWKKRILDLPDDSPTGNLIVPKNIIRNQNNEKYKNAILIAPAAFTNKGIPEAFWERLVQALNREGYEVYCNSGKLDYDKIIKGSKELVLSTKDLILNAPLFKHVIAVRSGFTDLVSKTEAKMTVLHLDGCENSPLRIEYGSRGDDVRDLGRINGIYPVLYLTNREDELIKLIIEDI